MHIEVLTDLVVNNRLLSDLIMFIKLKAELLPQFFFNSFNKYCSPLPDDPPSLPPLHVHFTFCAHQTPRLPPTPFPLFQTCTS